MTKMLVENIQKSIKSACIGSEKVKFWKKQIKEKKRIPDS